MYEGCDFHKRTGAKNDRIRKGGTGKERGQTKKKMLDCPQFAARSDYSQEAVADMLLKKNENWGIASIEKLGVIFVYFFRLVEGAFFFVTSN